MTQEVVCEELDMSLSNYNRIENGRIVPEIKTMINICHTLHIDLPVVQSLYIAELNDEQRLLELAAYLFYMDNDLHAKFVISKIIRLAKKKKKNHFILYGLQLLLNWELYHGRENLRLAIFINERLKELTKTQLITMHKFLYVDGIKRRKNKGN